MDTRLPAPDTTLLLRLIYERAREHALIFLDPTGRIAAWAPAAQEVFGWTAEEVTGRHVSVLFVPEDIAMGIPEHEMQVALLNGTAEDDRWSMRADGARFWASGALTALHHEGRHVGFCKVVRNRTEVREQVEKLRNQALEGEANLRRQDAFFTTLSHELRNPLAPLANAVGIIRMSAPPSKEVEYALRVIERQTDLMERLVGDLMDVSRVGAGKVMLERERMDVCEALRHAIDDCRPIAEQRRHRIDFLPVGGEIFVLADADRLHQVFVNLITNAVKYTPPAGHIWVKASYEGDEAVVRVEDNGVGLPPDMVPRIFDLFTQVEASRGESQGGLGVGLSLVKNLVELQGGSVQAKSDGPGKGSEFTVRLPLAAIEPAP
ncbi:MAG TPA: PAS domain-containing sensor histidine kinase [Usitatibacter sp.]|nr:PAS domain-containing sensor histidine kinase [Usitatibacter sp.]